LTEKEKAIRDFVFRGLLFESEAEVFQRAGIRVGIDSGHGEEGLLLEALAPFGVIRRNHALEMARLYAVLHAFENEVRSLIRDTLEEAAGPAWWEESVPTKIKGLAETRKKTAEKDSWLEGEKSDLLQFAEFGDLAAIIIHNWKNFVDIMPGQDWIRQRMSELEKANRMLLPSEYQRIYMYVSDWNKVVGV
jgi:hypothetical protein